MREIKFRGYDEKNKTISCSLGRSDSMIYLIMQWCNVDYCFNPIEAYELGLQ